MNAFLGMIGCAIGGVVSLICLYVLFDIAPIYYDFDTFLPSAFALAVIGFGAGGVIAALHKGEFEFCHCLKLIWQVASRILFWLLLINLANAFFFNFNREALLDLSYYLSVGATTLTSILTVFYWAFSRLGSVQNTG